MSLVLRPRKLRRVSRLAAAVVLLVFGALAALLPTRAAEGQRIGLGDQLSFFAIGLLLAVGVLALSRPRVRASVEGIWVRNVVGERFFPWAVVILVHLPDGAPWAQLELHDDQQVPLLALQANDGPRALEGIAALTELRPAAG